MGKKVRNRKNGEKIKNKPIHRKHEVIKYTQDSTNIEGSFIVIVCEKYNNTRSVDDK